MTQAGPEPNMVQGRQVSRALECGHDRMLWVTPCLHRRSNLKMGLGLMSLIGIKGYRSAFAEAATRRQEPGLMKP
jgi:hypothetical protein